MQDVITIGTATRDVFLRSEVFKGISDPHFSKKVGFPSGIAQCFPFGGKIEVEEPVITTGGGATNAAVTFARMGFRAAALFKIGDDAIGKEIVRELEDESITPFPVKDLQNPTAYSTILLSPSGERTILVHRGASEEMRRADVPLSTLTGRWAYIAPGGIPFPVMETILKALKTTKTAVAINPSKDYLSLPERKRKALFAAASVVLLNREEAAYATGINYKREKEIFEKMDEWVDGIVAVTDGANGVTVSDGAHLYRAGVFKERVVADRTGAGDAFGSGFVAGLIGRTLNTSTIQEAIRIGSAHATSVVEHVGAKRGILKIDGLEARRWRSLSVSISNL
jgi:ribokinase